MIREALGMSIPQLANRLGRDRQTVLALEKREATGSITIKSLRKAAEAMDCELIYAVIPRLELEQMVRNQALRRAGKQLNRVDHTMRLEGQAVSPDEHQRQVAEMAQALLAGSTRTLWSD